MQELVTRWAVLPAGIAKEQAKQRVDDFAYELVQMGHSIGVVNDIVLKSVQDGKGTFIRAASGGESARNRARNKADTDSYMYNKRAEYRRSRL